MSDGVSDVVFVGSGSGEAGDGSVMMAGLDSGFLGTGYSASVEFSFIAMALIAGYVIVSTARYFLHGTNVLSAVADALGFER